MNQDTCTYMKQLNFQHIFVYCLYINFISMSLSPAPYLHFIGRVTIFPCFQAFCPHDPAILTGYRSQMEAYEFLPLLRLRVETSAAV